MAVPPIQPTRAVGAGPTGLVRALGVPLMLDVVLGLLVAVVLPLAIVAIPNTISVVAALLPPEVSQIAMIRAHGLALPAMVLTMPVAAVLVRRVRAAPMVVAGLTLLAFADAAGGYAGSTALVGILRVLHGVGAGLLVPATLMAVWGRSPFLRVVWAATLAASLLAAQALALWPLDQVDSWRVTLQPYPMLTGVALVLAALYLVLWLKDGEGAAGPDPGGAARGRTLWAVVPAAGVAALALGSTFDWSASLVIRAALVSVLVLLALASSGASRGAVGRAPAYAMVAVGVVVLPTAAQVTYVELGGLGGPGLSGLWSAFAIAAVVALLAAALTNRLGVTTMPMVTAGGLVVVVAGLCAVRLFLPTSGGLALILPFALLAGGTSVALTGALRSCAEEAALLALSLFFPAVLAGFLLGSGVQVAQLREARTPQALVDGFVGALHLWTLVGGGLVLVVIVLAAVLARLLPGSPDSLPGSPDSPPDAGTADVSPMAGPASGLVPSPAGEADPAGGAWQGAVTRGQPGPTVVRPRSEAVAGSHTPARSKPEARPMSGSVAAAGGGTGAGKGNRSRPRHEPDRVPESDPDTEPEPEKVVAPPVVVPPPAPSPEDGPGGGPALQ
ncbi:hypothetical protein OG884_05485 [Streptosporangium sp. NBC_01755]|uniref:hypothetical protein n=1 Tax=unclassified Streptosporangium TaxID=2632669 RepID=UPI002DDC6DFB|nr:MULTISPECIES: hypothetical protein [unclassified Streptosporangium]WSA27061.1 hypothetical protein OIE13_04000 [Streptosporangium sp. NBC_01810]WSD01381.1 hypothetical protein OG884_05485 [Streptosporangium sp. NBC_01755]